MTRSQKEHDERLHKYSVERLEREALIADLQRKLARAEGLLKEIEEFDVEAIQGTGLFHIGIVIGVYKCAAIARRYQEEEK